MTALGLTFGRYVAVLILHLAVTVTLALLVFAARLMRPRFFFINERLAFAYAAITICKLISISNMLWDFLGLDRVSSIKVRNWCVPYKSIFLADELDNS